VVGLELIGIIAAVTGSLLAGETTRRVAARVVASMPESLRQRQGVAERYAVLDRPPQLRDSTRALATSGWTFVFVAFFTVLQPRTSQSASSWSSPPSPGSSLEATTG
jgi:hypothetical protein